VSRRLLFCTQTAHVWGGLEVWLDEVVPFLESRGWEVIVALARGRRFHDPDAYRAAHPKLKTVEVDGRHATREARVAALRKTIREVQPDVVVPVNIADTIEAVAREKLDGSNVRLVVMLRSIVPHGELEDLRRWRDFIDVAVGGNRLLRALIAAWAKIPEERLRYIPPGSRRKLQARQECLAHTIRIAYVGRLEEHEKRALDLVGFVRGLDARGVKYELLIAGEGPARAALEFELGHSARFLGRVSVDELYASVFPAIDVLVLFSVAEAGPQVVWQAMHYGVVPVVSQYRGARAEGILRDGETALLFPVGDPESAAAQVERLANDPELRARIAGAAERAVDPEYLLDHSLERWRLVFEEAMALPRAVGRELPELRPSGLLERLHLPAYSIRRALGRLPEPRDPGDEWPHHGGIDAASIRRIDDLMIELDR
jgi:glycosyltransferase involved in cell wall biosynthesis